MKFVVSKSQLEKVLSFTEKDIKISINEGRNEDDALKILVKNNMEDSDGVFKILSSIDKSKNHKLLPVITSFYVFNFHNEPNIITELTNIFGKIFDSPNYEKLNIQLKNSTTISINNTDFKVENLSGFIDYVNHFLYKDTEEVSEEEKNLISTDANIVFENKKYIIYYAASKNICVDLFGEYNEERRYPQRTFCIGKQEATNYETYRDPSGQYKRTFYVVVNKDDIKKKLDKALTVTVVSVKRNENDELIYEVWDKSNNGSGDSVEGFDSIGEYIKNLKDEGVNINIFKPKKYIDISDTEIDNLLKNPLDWPLFNKLSPKQKYKYVSIKAKTLSLDQIEFLLKSMPEQVLKNFVTNISILGNISPESFKILPTQLKKSYITSKLIQLSNKSKNFSLEYFKSYVKENPELLKYAEKKSIELFNKSEENQNENIEFSQLMSMLSPSLFFNSLKNKKEITLSPNTTLINELPINFGEYVKNAEKLTIRNMYFKKIPNSIGECQSLTELTITDCTKLTYLPDEITNIKSLEEIIVTNCGLESLPDNIGNLKNLQILNCNQNEIKSIPTSIGNCSSLQMLHMEKNQIINIPPQTFFRGDVPLKDKDDKINSKLIKLQDLFLVNFDLNPLNDESLEVVELLRKIGDIDIGD